MTISSWPSRSGRRTGKTGLNNSVIVGVRYADYLISFIHHGVREIKKDDPQLDEIIPENITRIYGSFTTFNVLFRNKEQWFVGDTSKE